jgi:hypothetical protein
MKRQLAFATAVAMLAATAPGASAALLSVDVDDRETVAAGTETGNTVAGFQSFTLTGTTAAQPNTTRTLGAYTVTVTALNAAGTAQGGIDDRDRATPTTAPNYNQIYDDFMFTAAGVGLGGGIDLAISGGALLPNTPYRVALYSFDTGSTAAPQPRTADWFDGNNGNALVLQTSFNAADSPAADNQYRFTGLALTDASGALLLKGRSTTGNASAPGVFVNGFEIDVIPEPTSAGLACLAGLAMAAFRRRVSRNGPDLRANEGSGGGESAAPL